MLPMRNFNQNSQKRRHHPTQCFFFWAWKAISMAWKILDFFEYLPVKKNYAREKFQKTLQKCAWKSLFTRENFWKLHPWKSNWCTWKIIEKNPVKKAKNPQKSENVTRETVFFAREKKWKSAREKKFCAWKNLKNPKKVRVKMKFCAWKKRKIGKKRLSRPLFFSRPKKKNTVVTYWFFISLSPLGSL